MPERRVIWFGSSYLMLVKTGHDRGTIGPAFSFVNA